MPGGPPQKGPRSGGIPKAAKEGGYTAGRSAKIKKAMAPPAGRSGVDVLVSGGPGLAKPVSERAKTENRKQGGARGPPPGALGGHRAAARGSAGGKISGRILGARVGMRGRAPGWSLGLASHQIVQGLDRLSAQVRERRWWRASVTYPPHECGLARRAHQPSGSAPAATRARLDRRAAP
jgi:hypothetical protein